MFVDTAKVNLKAGKGGDGAVSFRHEIYIPKGGPDGGDGGKGGDIIFRADRNTNTLIDFCFTPILTAEDGKNGSGTRSAGRSGKDLIVDVPVGTCVYKVSELGSFESIRDNGSDRRSEPRNDGREQGGSRKDLIAELVKDGDEAIIAHGGSGGFGNAHFKSSTRQAPIIAEVGEPGEEFEAELELKTVADVGLVGLPNAGKSTFLSVISNAKPEIADYPFTTITPNLGVATIDEKDLLIADIPGLIKGASEGKGLGHDFLRHVDRTSVLLHLVDIYNNDAGEAYQTIRTELEKYSNLASRPEIVALTKCEGVDEDIIKMQTASILAKNPDAKIFTISSQAHQGLVELLRELKQVVIANQNTASSKLTEATAEDGQVAPEKGVSDKYSDLPTISLNSDVLKDTWSVTKTDDKFIVTGEKIEKFARKTDLNNYASLNRLRDIMKKMGIRAELTNQGAKPESIIEIAGKEFTLVEDY